MAVLGGLVRCMLSFESFDPEVVVVPRRRTFAIDQTATERSVRIFRPMLLVLYALLHRVSALLVVRIMQLAVVIELPLAYKVHVIALDRLAFLDELDPILDLHDLRRCQVMEFDNLLPMSLEVMRGSCFIWFTVLLVGQFKIVVRLLS